MSLIREPRSSKQQMLDCWKAYKMKCETSFVTRNGIIACGVVKEPNVENLYEKPEFVSEHEGRSAFLYALLIAWCKENNGPDCLRKIESSDMFLLLCHDIGEILNGDALDDGSSPHDESRHDETKLFSEFCDYLPIGLDLSIRHRYGCFENYNGSLLTKFCKVVDKAEAIAFQLFLATKGFTGDIMKKEHPSGRDLRFGRLIGCNKSIDVWTLHFRVVTKGIEEELLEPVTAFLNAGFLDAYGSIPTCMTIDVEDIPLDVEDISFDVEAAV